MTAQKASNGMNVVLWIAQVILSASLVWSASLKLFQPIAQLAEMWPWAADHPGLVKLTGVLDVLAAFGLVLPALLHIQPNLTVFAAWGVIALMIAASIFHISRGEGAQIGVNIFFAVIAALIAWGRQKKVPIASR